MVQKMLDRVLRGFKASSDDDDDDDDPDFMLRCADDAMDCIDSVLAEGDAPRMTFAERMRELERYLQVRPEDQSLNSLDHAARILRERRAIDRRLMTIGEVNG